MIFERYFSLYVPAGDLERSYVGEVPEVEQCGDSNSSTDLLGSVSDERAVLEAGKVAQPSLRVHTRTCTIYKSPVLNTSSGY